MSDYETWSQIETLLLEAHALAPDDTARGGVADLLREALERTRLHKIWAWNRQAPPERERDHTARPPA